MRLSIDLEFDNFNQLLDFIHILSKNQVRVVDSNNYAHNIIMDGRKAVSSSSSRGAGGRPPIIKDNQWDSVGNGHHVVQRDTFKLKRFFQIFNSLANENSKEVDRTKLLEQLVEDGKFTIEEAQEFIQRGIENGQITIKERGMITRTDLSL